MSNSLQPHGLQHARLPCPLLPPRVCSNSCPSISDAIQPPRPLSPPYPPALNLSHIRVFSNKLALHIRWLKILIRASASVLPVNIQGWFPLGLTGWISLQSKRLSGSMVENISARAGGMGSISGWGRFPGEEHGNPLQYSCLENPVDRGAWWATVHGVAKELVTRSWLSD